MPAYEAGGFLPPAPVARVVVRGTAGQSQADLPMLIDPGADVSIIPRRVAVDRRLGGADGRQRRC